MYKLIYKLLHKQLIYKYKMYYIKSKLECFIEKENRDRSI